MQLRPGEIIGEAWRLYREHWRHFLPIALVVYLIIGVVTLLLVLLLGWFGAVLGGLLGIVGAFWLQGALTEAVSDVRDGRADLTLSETFRRVQPKLWTIVGAGLLAGLGIAAGFIVFIIPGLILLTWWCLIVPSIVLEGKPAMESFGRSRELVRGNGWNVFGVIVLTILIVIAFSIVVSLLLFWIPGDEVRAFVQNVVQNTLAYPFMALALTLTYFALARPAAAPAPAAAPTGMGGPAPTEPIEPTEPSPPPQPPPAV
jgi:hypothetical protein